MTSLGANPILQMLLQKLRGQQGVPNTPPFAPPTQQQPVGGAPLVPGMATPIAAPMPGGAPIMGSAQAPDMLGPHRRVAMPRSSAPVAAPRAPAATPISPMATPAATPSQAPVAAPMTNQSDAEARYQTDLQSGPPKAAPLSTKQKFIHGAEAVGMGLLGGTQEGINFYQTHTPQYQADKTWQGQEERDKAASDAEIAQRNAERQQQETQSTVNRNNVEAQNVQSEITDREQRVTDTETKQHQNITAELAKAGRVPIFGEDGTFTTRPMTAEELTLQQTANVQHAQGVTPGQVATQNRPRSSGGRSAHSAVPNAQNQKQMEQLEKHKDDQLNTLEQKKSASGMTHGQTPMSDAAYWSQKAQIMKEYIDGIRAAGGTVTIDEPTMEIFLRATNPPGDVAQARRLAGE